MTYLKPVILLVLLLLAVALPLIRRRPREARGTISAALLILFLWSWPPVTRVTSWTLERWYDATPFPAGEAEAIVVLSADVDFPADQRFPAELKEATYRRTRHAAWLYRHWRKLPVLASGGRISRRASDPAAAEVMREALLATGVPPEDALVETWSQSTHGNAFHSARILRERGVRRIALVTEAIHMPRAAGCFRGQGLEVTPAPCAFRANKPLNRWEDWIPSPRAMLDNEDVLHEWGGLAWYWVSGKLQLEP